MSSSEILEPRRLVVLISGSGTNLQALIDALPSSQLSSPQDTSPSCLPNTIISLVLSNRKAAHGLTRASTATPPIPTAYLALQPYLKSNPGKTREDYDAEVARIVVDARPDVVVLAGWMHVLSQVFLDVVEEYTESSLPNPDGRKKRVEVVNLHPALPGAFDGANAIHRAYAAFQEGKITHSGVMLHRVVKEVDRGEPVLVREVEIWQGESEDDFEKRVHGTEWGIIVEGVRTVLDEVRPLS